MTCPNCGAEVNGNFCEYCGSEMKREQPQVINITNNYYNPADGTRSNPTPAQNVNQQPDFQQNFDSMFTNVNQNIQRKSKKTAIILAFFFGTLGAHNFYIGRPKKAIIQLGLTFFQLWIVTFIWSVLEGIIILASPAPLDGRGIPME